MLTKLLYRPTEAAQVLGMSRSGVFRPLSSGELESVKIGALRRIPAVALENYVRALRDRPADSSVVKAGAS
jgi:excisionase family DNA binding protein